MHRVLRDAHPALDPPIVPYGSGLTSAAVLGDRRPTYQPTGGARIYARIDGTMEMIITHTPEPFLYWP